jgi:hypothetical protein
MLYFTQRLFVFLRIDESKLDGTDHVIDVDTWYKLDDNDVEGKANLARRDKFIRRRNITWLTMTILPVVYFLIALFVNYAFL